ncbi:hydroxyacylglutathione hydrolase [Litoribrevibacter albus]|uniref:Hydroxyacylglutathione hydrolase n=2 Tax=Litoribrevibacter albus TaxID=1473156 RepID=A0AA37W8P7_9GAMM|nr:hydroxyacylglutathione hydrolase [Litoribrevibacter albus]
MPNATLDFQSFSITPIHAYSDNYIWCIHTEEKAWVVDPGDHKVVEAFLTEHKLDLDGIIITHHHWDHITGISKLTSNRQIPVYGPSHPKIPEVTEVVNEGDQLNIFGLQLTVLFVPGHTLEHIAYFGITAAGQPLLFCGDTLFCAGCGRLFEGTPAQMNHSLQRLTTLNDETLVFCTHEYTESNLKFALEVEPDNTDIEAELSIVQALDTSKQPSLPTSIAKEKRINPFLRASLPQIRQKLTEQFGVSADTFSEDECFAAVRRWKDNF